jgi:adenylate cyclase
MSEAADPVALVNQLNEYFASMVDIVFEHGGSLDKFIGDAVMARWGDLQTDGPALDARSAVLAALQMRKELARLNEKWTGEGRGQLSFGVGVHQGDAIFGNIGSEKKMEITVIGDAVNVGSRLEGLSKHYKCDLLVSESIAQHVRDEVVLRFVDLVRPPGKRTPVEIHHAIGRRDEVDPVFVKWLDEYHQAIALYRSREYGAAASEFSRLLQERTGDALCALYIERCQRFEKDPPPADWDGAETRKEK